MLEMDLDIWELVARAGVVYVVLLLLMRMSGKRTVGQFTPFDLLVVMLLSEAAGPSMVGKDQSLWGGLIVCMVLLAINGLVALTTTHFAAAERILEGEAVLLGRDGTLFESVRKRHRVSNNEVNAALRASDCEMHDMLTMFLEADGQITVQKAPSQRAHN
jgi:uncharacterized membrane protein YcaP (DUF421 family)